ncbi:SRPBCC family protein [Gordonia sp. PS3]|uniref:Polyketide cyclase/dehydrase n=1 Tax=Gordonia neofelifaecis NRRL B-59395 TaxID=644548 RepID=F1YM19_9ACTN|nr:MULTISPECIES: SRPBCC family protein [Gordonia]EGD54270.1 Polyketide cyclase/dehydrase [Gordonia neofelifaecis NRRL B-59395]KJR09005.1 polyketide cyclase/dehydrase [Gordonia sihwensis]KXT57104.1 polyketide cyclase/dehydrase [Gordonia sp. QH-12]
MISMQRTVTTTAPAVAVFDYLADFTNAEQWDPNAVKVIRLSDDAGTPSGDVVYRVTSRFAGRETDLDYRLVDLQPHTLIRLRGEKPAVTAVDTIRIEPRPDGTAVTYAVEFDFHGVFGLLAPLLRPAVRRLLEQGAVGLSEELARLG